MPHRIVSPDQIDPKTLRLNWLTTEIARVRAIDMSGEPCGEQDARYDYECQLKAERSALLEG